MKKQLRQQVIDLIQKDPSQSAVKLHTQLGGHLKWIGRVRLNFLRSPQGVALLDLKRQSASNRGSVVSLPKVPLTLEEKRLKALSWLEANPEGTQVALREATGLSQQMAARFVKEYRATLAVVKNKGGKRAAALKFLTEHPKATQADLRRWVGLSPRYAKMVWDMHQGSLPLQGLFGE